MDINWSELLPWLWILAGIAPIVVVGFRLGPGPGLDTFNFGLSWSIFYVCASAVFFLFPVIGFSVLAAAVIMVGSLWLTGTSTVAGLIAITIIMGSIFYQVSFLLP